MRILQIPARWLLVAGGAFAGAACDSQPTQQAGSPVKNWMLEPFEKSPQVLLTNGAAFTDGQRLDGASAFLLQTSKHLFAVTAKHLIGPDGGIEPKKLPSHLNAELVAWQLFARQRAADTVQLDRLLNTQDTDADDALIFSLQKAADHYQALTPRYDAPAKGEEVYLIGCPYAEADCTQNRYLVQVAETSATEYLLTKGETSDLRGFSGCPIVDKQGQVIGLLSSSVQYENGQEYILITPISVAMSNLQR